MDEFQLIYDILIGLAAGLGGWILRGVDKDIRDLRTQDSVLLTQVNALNVLVAGGYVKRDEMERAVDKLGAQLNSKLDLIFDRLETKADK
jgi:hypothetical protein